MVKARPEEGARVEAPAAREVQIDSDARRLLVVVQARVVRVVRQGPGPRTEVEVHAALSLAHRGLSGEDRLVRVGGMETVHVRA